MEGNQVGEEAVAAIEAAASRGTQTNIYAGNTHVAAFVKNTTSMLSPNPKKNNAGPRIPIPNVERTQLAASQMKRLPEGWSGRADSGTRWMPRASMPILKIVSEWHISEA